MSTERLLEFNPDECSPRDIPAFFPLKAESLRFMEMEGLQGRARVLVVSSINGDIMLSTPTYPAAGETVLAKRSGPTLGGKGANVAVAVSKSGLSRCKLAGAVGKDGEQLLCTLRSMGVDTTLVRCVESENTGTAYVIVDEEGENGIVVVPGANGIYNGDDRLREAMRGAVVVLQMEINGDVTKRIATEARQVGATVVLNPSPVPLQGSAFCAGDEGWSLVDIAVMNEMEFRKLSVREGGDDLEQRVRVFRERCADKGRVVVTMGKNGVMYVGEDGEVRSVAASDVDKVVDTTGAGDTVTGYLAAGVASGMELGKALELAVAAAGICVQRSGAAPSIPSGEEARRIVSGM